MRVVGLFALCLMSELCWGAGEFFPLNAPPIEVQQAFAQAINESLQSGALKVENRNVFGQQQDFVTSSSNEGISLLISNVRRRLGGRLPHIIDSFASFTINLNGKTVKLSQEILARISTDHHGPNFKANDARINSSMKLAQSLRTLGPAEFKATMHYVTTDNLADAVDGIFLAKHADAFASNPEMLDLFAEVASYEDFGLFGTDPVESAAAQSLSKAILHLYDNALKRSGIFSGGDRIDGKSDTDQTRIVNGLVAALETLWLRADGQVAPQWNRIGTLEAQFNVEQAQALSATKAKYESLIAQTDRDGEFGLKEMVIVEEALPISTETPGQFATWSATARLHPEAPISISISRKADGKNGLIISLLDGRGPDGDLRLLSQALKAKGINVNERGGRLLYDFVGSDVPQEEILRVVMNALGDENVRTRVLGLIYAQSLKLPCGREKREYIQDMLPKREAI